MRTLANKLARGLAGVGIVGMMAIGMMSLRVEKVWADAAVVGVSSSAAVDVMVTPIVNVSLIASPTTYNFGTLDLNTSSISATAISLKNDGNVSVTMQKHSANSDGTTPWTIGTSTGADQFALYSATASARPSLKAIELAAHRLAVALSNLQGDGGSTQVSLKAAETADLWFEIHMPTTTTTGSKKTIPVHFVGTAQ